MAQGKLHGRSCHGVLSLHWELQHEVFDDDWGSERILSPEVLSSVWHPELGAFEWDVESLSWPPQTSPLGSRSALDVGAESAMAAEL
ncbi:hypothetical protein N7520_004517 [Penicillium odoratum]|uniref:uncharacterized protein n=1 Tax=Penicillium odoratum TaxID=1167516 RepID=UPI002546B400|nr:uncharacterized protein N7520_004517 [Penicillium odoratum]KAJ5764958.1 hypothetical protein N7520_004517 [Penicillium odoratum]